MLDRIVNLSEEDKSVAIPTLVKEGDIIGCIHKASTWQQETLPPFFVENKQAGLGPDPKYQERARLFGMHTRPSEIKLWGAYHTLGPGRGAAQAQLFLEVVRDVPALWSRSHLLMLNLEQVHPSSEAQTAAIDFVNTIYNETGGHYPIVYGTAETLDKLKVTGTVLTKCHLTVVDFRESAEKPKMPEGWTDYVFWAYTDKGQTAGVGGNCHRIRYSGTVEALEKLWKTFPVISGHAPSLELRCKL